MTGDRRNSRFAFRRYSLDVILARPLRESGLNLLLLSDLYSENSRPIRVCELFSRKKVADGKEFET